MTPFSFIIWSTLIYQWAHFDKGTCWELSRDLPNLQGRSASAGIYDFGVSYSQFIVFALSNVQLPFPGGTL